MEGFNSKSVRIETELFNESYNCKILKCLYNQVGMCPNTHGITPNSTLCKRKIKANKQEYNMNPSHFAFKVYKNEMTEDKLKDIIKNKDYLFKASFVEESDYYWVTVTEVAPNIGNIDILNCF